jgi:hypothetical protein
MKTANTHLILQSKTVLRLAPTTSANYQILHITAADCRVTGGQLVGDVRSHLGDGGEWGHGVRLSGTAHRTRLGGLSVTECWGDGYYVGGGPDDVLLVDCTAQNNKRQGLSITSAVRPGVVRGRYAGTGWPLRTNPSAGIDLEPNEGETIVDAVLRSVELVGNRGPGLVVSGSRGTTTAQVIGGSSSNNDGPGYLISGAEASVIIRSATSTGNQVGVEVERRVIGCTIDHVTANQNRAVGFAVAGARSEVRSSIANGNGAEGCVH